MKIKTKLKFNKEKLGTGKTWLAKISCIDTKFGFKREFINSKQIEKSTMGNWKFSYTIKEDGYYQFYEQNNEEVNVMLFKKEGKEKVVMTEEEFKEEVSLI